jgi:hypothetical protein
VGGWSVMMIFCLGEDFDFDSMDEFEYQPTSFPPHFSPLTSQSHQLFFWPRIISFPFFLKKYV